eukprot:6245568-Pyramimonas_sp.AAC.1
MSLGVSILLSNRPRFAGQYCRRKLAAACCLATYASRNALWHKDAAVRDNHDPSDVELLVSAPDGFGDAFGEGMFGRPSRVACAIILQLPLSSSILPQQSLALGSRREELGAKFTAIDSLEIAR